MNYFHEFLYLPGLEAGLEVERSSAARASRHRKPPFSAVDQTLRLWLLLFDMDTHGAR